MGCRQRPHLCFLSGNALIIDSEWLPVNRQWLSLNGFRSAVGGQLEDKGQADETNQGKKDIGGF